MLRIPSLIICLICVCLSGCLVDDLRSNKSSRSLNKPIDGAGEDFSLQGRAGIIDGGLISVFSFQEDGSLSERPIAQTLTDIQGYYQVLIPADYWRSPALVTVSGGGAWAKCLVFPGCGDARFGDWFSVSEEKPFLSVVVPELMGSAPANLSVLTHIGAELFHHASLTSTTSQKDISTAIFSANSQVLNVFGLVGDLPSLQPHDVSHYYSNSSVSPLEMRYSIVNGALVAEALSAYREHYFTPAVDRFIEQFLSVGIPGKRGAAEVSKEGILEKVEELYRSLQMYEGPVYAKELSEVAALKKVYQIGSRPDYDMGSPSDSASLSAIEKGRKLLNGVREVALSLDLRQLVKFTNLASFTSGGVADALKGFGVELDASFISKEQELEKKMAALDGIASHIMDRLMMYFEGQNLPSDSEEVGIRHKITATEHSFEINRGISLCHFDVFKDDENCFVPANLLISVKFSSYRGNAGARTLFVDDLALNIQGFLGDEKHKLIFLENEDVLKIGMLFLQQGVGDVQDKILVEIADWKVNLPMALDSLDEEGNSRLEGAVSSKGERAGIIFVQEENQIVDDDQNVVFEHADVIEIYDLHRMAFSGGFSIKSATKNDFYAAFNIGQGDSVFTGSALFKTIAHRTCSKLDQVCTMEEKPSEIVGETDENFIRLSASIAYKAHLKAVAKPVLIQITGSRESPKVNALNSLHVSYEGNALHLSGRFNNNGGMNALDARNLDGMRVYFDTVDRKRTGALESYAKEKIADVIDMGQWVKVRYIDGVFESL